MSLPLFGDELPATPAPAALARCVLVTPQPRAFPHVKHADEEKTTTVDASGVRRLTWTCRACGNVRGRL